VGGFGVAACAPDPGVQRTVALKDYLRGQDPQVPVRSGAHAQPFGMGRCAASAGQRR
jgi:hypothetical protein